MILPNKNKQNVSGIERVGCTNIGRVEKVLYLETGILPTSLQSALRLPQMCHSPPHEPIDNNNRQHDTNPFARVASTVAILLQYSLPIDLALRSQCALIETVTSLAAVIRSLTEFIDHHASENVRLLREVRISLLKTRDGGSHSQYNGKHISKMDLKSLGRPKTPQRSSTNHWQTQSEPKRRQILGNPKT